MSDQLLKHFLEYFIKKINLEWLRGGTNITFTGSINFEGSQFTPLPGQFNLRVVGQNVSNSGQPVGDEVIFYEEQTHTI